MRWARGRYARDDGDGVSLIRVLVLVSPAPEKVPPPAPKAAPKT